MNKQFLHFIFFLLMCFTLPLTATAQVVNIPAPNLRAAVENALSKASGALITASDMATLTCLEPQNANISDLSGLEHATNLTELKLGRNNIADISVMAGLTNLATLWVQHNHISDLSPLLANTGLGSGDTVDVRDNPLSYQSLYTSIPALQSRGLSVEFDAGGTRPPDANKDGRMDILDLILIAQSFGTAKGDINGDGTTDVLDLTLVAQAFSE